jgi:hypothetical protein
MTGVVSGERANSARLTGAAGLLILGGAVAMMAMTAPSQAHPEAHAAVTSSATLAAQSDQRPAMDACHQLTSRIDSTTVRRCLAGPSAVRAWEDAYTPAMISESWSASRAGRAARPPLAGSAVS